MRATAKLAFLVAVMAMTASVNAWAQTRDRSVDAQAPAEKPVTPELPPVFTVNNNIVGYYYLPTATNPGAGQTPKNALFFSHFDVWNYGTNFFNVEWFKATNGRAPPFGTPAAPCDQHGPLDPPGSSRCPGYMDIYGFFRSTFRLEPDLQYESVLGRAADQRRVHCRCGFQYRQYHGGIG
jgi:hypothetical protein